MNNFTTKEQSLNLVKLGLNRDTADMCYYYNFVTETNSEIPAVVVGTLHDTTSNNIPCWSVGQLLKLMPKIKNSDKVYYPYLGLNRDGNFICVYRFNDNDWHWYIENDVVEVCYQMIVWLLQNNYIKTE